MSTIPAAMSFPASGVESAYRNNLKDVAKMLKTKHQENYMVLLGYIRGWRVPIIISTIKVCYTLLYVGIQSLREKL